MDPCGTPILIGLGQIEYSATKPSALFDPYKILEYRTLFLCNAKVFAARFVEDAIQSLT